MNAGPPADSVGVERPPPQAPAESRARVAALHYSEPEKAQESTPDPPYPVGMSWSAQRQRRWLFATLFVLTFVGFAYTLTVPDFATTAIGLVRGTLVAGTVFIGAIVLFSLYVFTKHDELERMRVLEERRRSEASVLRYRLIEVAGLFDAAILMSVHPDLSRVLELVCRRTVAALNATVAGVFLQSPDGEGIELKACDGAHLDVLRRLKIKEGEGVIGEVIAHGRPTVFRPVDLVGASGNDRLLAQLGVLVVLPVRVNAAYAGALIVSGGESLADTESVAAMALFSESLGSALARIGKQREAESRTMALERVNRELTEHQRKAEVFLATATHELRTPLSGIVSYAEVLADYYDSLSDQERRALCVSLSQQCKTMTGLVDDLFDFVRLESGRLTLDAESTSAAELVISAVNLMAPVAAERGLRIEQQIPDIGSAMLDSTKIRQCVLNLLSNAIKFTEPGGSITVKAAAHPKGVEVTVTDTGRGVSAEDQDRIFNLYQSGSTRRADKSLGLGLYLVKSFVELHGGQVWVKSEIGRGSTFGFSLPWAPPGMSASQPPHAA
jgi:signal transduction histidine kinase